MSGADPEEVWDCMASQPCLIHQKNENKHIKIENKDSGPDWVVRIDYFS